MTNYAENSPYLNPETRLGSELRFPIPSLYSSADGSERRQAFFPSDTGWALFAGPMNRDSVDRWEAIEINGIPASIPNAEIIRLLNKCVTRKLCGGRSFFTFHQIMGSPDTQIGYMIENRKDA